MPDRLLVNFFYAHPVGHAIEALHYANGYHAADPELEIAVALNAATPVELAAYCPAVRTAYAIDHPFVEPAANGGGALDAVPREWTWIVDDGRRHESFQLELFPGMRDYYAASDRHLAAERKRGYTGGSPPPYLPHQPVRLALPAGARAAAARRLGDERPRISGSLPYERALDEYFAALVAAHGGDASQIWSIDGVHAARGRP